MNLISSNPARSKVNTPLAQRLEPKLPRSTKQRLKLDEASNYKPNQLVKDEYSRTLASINAHGELTEANVFHKNGTIAMQYNKGQAPVESILGRPAQPLLHNDIVGLAHYHRPNRQLVQEKKFTFSGENSGVALKQFYYSEDGQLHTAKNKEYDTYGLYGKQQVTYQHHPDGSLKQSKAHDFRTSLSEKHYYNTQKVLKRTKEYSGLITYYQNDGSRFVVNNYSGINRSEQKVNPTLFADDYKEIPRWEEIERGTPTLEKINNTHRIVVENPYRNAKAAATLRTTKHMAAQGMIPEGTIIKHTRLVNGLLGSYLPSDGTSKAYIQIDANQLDSTGMNHTLTPTAIKANNYTVGDSFQDTLAHEIGHQKHDAELRKKGLDLFSEVVNYFKDVTLQDLKLIEQYVSRYATEKPRELVAELENLRVAHPEKFKALPAIILQIAEQYHVGDMFKKLL
jgi:hypothetical protein